MIRWSAAAFGVLVVATVGAFFVSQHLKVSTPLIAGIGRAVPSVINPVAGPTCGGVSHRAARFSFYLLHRADDVDVYVIDQSGNIVRTLASGRHMRRGVRRPDGEFSWNGRADNHRVAPDGTYEIEVGLIHQGRTVILSTASGPVTIKLETVAPRPVVDRVSPQLIPQLGHAVTIRYSGNEGRGATIRLYRTDLTGTPLVKTFVTPWRGQKAIWDGTIHGRPAPAGIYLVGMEVTDAACNTGYFPARVPPARGSTPHAGVTVRYLAAQPPLRPVPAGTDAAVDVEANGATYQWSLVRAGNRRPAASGVSAAASLAVALPSRRAGLYELQLRAGTHSTAVPLVASAARPAPILVVLPALTWQGLNPVDDTGDGIPSTLAAGDPITLSRPLARGLPSGFSDEAGLLAYLDGAHRAYTLTTDLGLIDGSGPALSGHATVILAGSERWLPSATMAALRGYVTSGGHVLSLGTDSLRRTVTVAGGRALDPGAPRATDAFGVRPGTSRVTNSYLGRGSVVEIAAPGFGASLSRAGSARALVAQILATF